MALSFISLQQARRNLQVQVCCVFETRAVVISPHLAPSPLFSLSTVQVNGRSFDQCRQSTQTSWRQQMSAVQVSLFSSLSAYFLDMLSLQHISHTSYLALFTAGDIGGGPFRPHHVLYGSVPHPHAADHLDRGGQRLLGHELQASDGSSDWPHSLYGSVHLGHFSHPGQYHPVQCKLNYCGHTRRQPTRKFFFSLFTPRTRPRQIPLLTILRPDVAQDIGQSLVGMYQEGGDIPRWPIANVYTGW